MLWRMESLDHLKISKDVRRHLFEAKAARVRSIKSFFQQASADVIDRITEVFI